MLKEKQRLDFFSKNEEEYNLPFSVTELRQSLQKANDLATGLDQVHYQLLTHLPNSALSVLLKVYNDIWESGCFLPSWHEAVVIPIPKPGKDHSDPGNFRPAVCVKQWRGWSTLASCGPSSRRVFFPRSSAASGRTTVRWIILFILKCRSVLKQLDPIHYQGLRIGLGAFRTSPALYIEAHEPPLTTRQLKLSLNYVLKLKSLLENPAYSCVFEPQNTRLFEESQSNFGPNILLGKTHIKVVGEAKFFGVIFDTKLTFLNHIQYLKTSCQKVLDILHVVGHTDWGADRIVLLRLYCSLVHSKLDYGCIVYGSACQSILKQLDPIHHQGLWIALGAFRTSPAQSLYIEAHEPSLTTLWLKLSLCS